MRLPEGWWLCLRYPREAWREIERSRRIIRTLHDHTTRCSYALSWAHSELGELTRRVARMQADLAYEVAARAALRDGADADAALAAGQTAYDETLWLERVAQESWVERERKWVGDTMAQIEKQRQEANLDA